MSTPKSRKQKGSKFQKCVAKLIRDAFGFKERQVVSTPPSVTGEDILMTDDVKHIFPFSIEAKCREKLNIWSALKQAQNNTPDNRIPMVVFKRNRSDIYCCINFEEFLKIYKGIK